MKGVFDQLFMNQHGSRRDRWISELKRIARLSGLRRVAPLLFCHIPKCAGTSFRVIVESEYRRDQCVLHYSGEADPSKPNQQFLEWFRTIRRTVQIVYGHFSFGVHRFLGVPPVYATIVREPVSRIVSLYRHIARDPASPFFACVNTGLPLKEFVTSRITEQTNNHMTRIIAGDMPWNPGVVVYENESLERAKANIENYFCVVGTVEAMGDVVRVLGQRFAWRNHVIPTLNVMPHARVDLDDETRNVIVEHNRLDLALYEWIRVKGYRSFNGGK